MKEDKAHFFSFLSNGIYWSELIIQDTFKNVYHLKMLFLDFWLKFILS